ncbi:hypothetical protein AMTR_s00152p00042360 [Amborella trichopoda]|uniref:Uncharacterized protein n=1 Tax=Amborella trichopoda TaxID=13333 RepID=W1PET9_AMBTC|nr:hypothetical protein AMTR_s00152p00042360 [Amborella trichopoda]
MCIVFVAPCATRVTETGVWRDVPVDLIDTLSSELCTAEFCARKSVVLVSAVRSDVKGTHGRELRVVEYCARQSTVPSSAVCLAMKGAHDKELCATEYCAW